MKKLLWLPLFMFLLLGCKTDMSNTPTKRAEELLNKYQTLDSEVTNQLANIIDEEDITTEQRTKYNDIYKNQYKNMTYTIKDEEINGDEAIVKVEIEVYDYSKIGNNINEHLSNNPDIFNDEEGTYSMSKYTDYKLNLLSESKDRTKYTLDLTATKKDGKWIVDSLTETERQKIHGIYES